MPKQRRARRVTPSAAGTPAGSGSNGPTPAKRQTLFLAITVLMPVLLLAGIEGGLRLAWPAGRMPLFVPVPRADSAYLVANSRVGGRWFAGERTPPAPAAEPFATRKPDRAFRVFVLGESSTAGFPYPRNGTFSRVLGDVLRDVLPSDSIEVVNLGIAATNSYAMVDLADEVLAQAPDAVLVYAGHNEYYGALGVGSTQTLGGAGPSVVRGYLRLLRFRVVLAMREAIIRVRGAVARDAEGADAAAASLMESLAREQAIVLGDAIYRRGVRQFEDNLGLLVARLREAGVPVFAGSLVSNLRDQPPFASRLNRGPGGAQAAFDAARGALAHGDTVRARALFVRARDLDVVRFRAPSDFNAVVRQVVGRAGGTYVPVAETFAAASPAGIPGRELLLEHVHPTRAGQVLLARTYFEALRDADFLGRPVRLARLRSWEDYMQRMALTAFDERVAEHTVRTLLGRWPFVPADRQEDYRGTYRAAGTLDSLALLVSRGAPWEAAKLQLAAEYQRSGRPAAAADEYRGLIRDAPLAHEPLQLFGRALAAAGDTAAAAAAFTQAMAVHPTAESATALGVLALRRRDPAAAIGHLRRALELAPDRPDVLYHLSLVYGQTRDIARARATALRLAQLDPRYPGLAGWLNVLGLAP